VLTWNVALRRSYTSIRERRRSAKGAFELSEDRIPDGSAMKFWEQLLKDGRASSELTHFTKDGQPVFVERGWKPFPRPAGLRILKSDWEHWRAQAGRAANKTFSFAS